MYDFHVHDCTQEQNSSPYFSSIIQQHNGRLYQERLLRSRNFEIIRGVTLPAELTMYLLCG